MAAKFKVAIGSILVLLVLGGAVCGYMFVFSIASMEQLFGTADEHLEEFRGRVETVVTAEELRHWGDDMFLKLPGPLNEQGSYSLIPPELVLRPLQDWTNSVSAAVGFYVRYDDSQKPERVDFVRGFGRLMEGVSIFALQETAKTELNERGTYSVEIGPGAFCLADPYRVVAQQGMRTICFARTAAPRFRFGRA